MEVSHPDAHNGVSRIVRCRNCGLRRLDPRPNPAALSCYYGTAYNAFLGRSRGPLKQAVWDFLRDVSSAAPGRGRRWRMLRPLLRPVAESAFDINVPLDGERLPRVLDVGCGYGDLLMYLKSHSCEVQGVDFDERAAAKGKEYGVPIHVGELHDLNLPDASFDVGVLCHSLEHLPLPGDQLRELARVLKPGARLHIAVPNGGAVGLRRESVAWGHLSHPLHFWYFDAASLTRLLHSAGFTLVKISYATTWRHHAGLWRGTGATRGLLAAVRETLGFLRDHARAQGGGDILRVVAVCGKDREGIRFG